MAKKIYFGAVVGLSVALAFSFAHIKPVAAQTTCVAPQEPEVQYTVYSYGIFSTTSHVVTFYEYPASACAALPETLDPNGEESSDPTNSQALINNCKSNAVQYQNALDAYQSCIQSSTNENTSDTPVSVAGSSTNPLFPPSSLAVPNNPSPTAVSSNEVCNAGYVANVYGQCVQEQTSTPSVPATPPVVSNVVSPAISSTSPIISSVPAETFTVSQNLNVGASGQNVTDLQNFLIAKGFLTMPAGTNEGYFGGLTKRALIAFQQSVGLPDTGYCGPMTRGVINAGN